MDAFVYPAAPSQRRHGPLGYTDAQGYRPWLRDEFCFRCAYCLLREQWGLVRGTFDIDHFLPAALRPEKALDYKNLVYACATCNALKSIQLLPNPERALVEGEVHVNEDGMIVGLTRSARWIIRVLGLDSAEYTHFRALWIGIVALAAKHDAELCRKLMGFPADLPNIARLRPPKGNTRPEGVQESWHARKQSGTLPETY